MESIFGFYALDRNEDFDWSLALRDVVTLWVESVFILDRNEGLAVFPGVSSWVSCRFSISLAEWALVMSYSALYYVVLRLGASRVE